MSSSLSDQKGINFRCLNEYVTITRNIGEITDKSLCSNYKVMNPRGKPPTTGPTAVTAGCPAPYQSKNESILEDD